MFQTIKMLVVVVILFAFCWLPLNVFNVLQEFNVKIIANKSVTHSTVYFVCHWLAMSSVCYNPFIYCWLNDHFRAGAMQCLCLISRLPVGPSGSSRYSAEGRASSATNPTSNTGVDSTHNSFNERVSLHVMRKKSSQRIQKVNEFGIPLNTFNRRKASHESALLSLADCRADSNANVHDSSSSRNSPEERLIKNNIMLTEV